MCRISRYGGDTLSRDPAKYRLAISHRARHEFQKPEGSLCVDCGNLGQIIFCAQCLSIPREEAISVTDGLDTNLTKCV